MPHGACTHIVTTFVFHMRCAFLCAPFCYIHSTLLCVHALTWGVFICAKLCPELYKEVLYIEMQNFKKKNFFFFLFFSLPLFLE